MIVCNVGVIFSYDFVDCPDLGIINIPVFHNGFFPGSIIDCEFVLNQKLV